VLVSTYRPVSNGLTTLCDEIRGRVARWAFAAMVLALATLVLSVGVALAETPRLIPYGSFAPGPNPIGVAVDNSCSLHTPPLVGSACTVFDGSSGDVYVAGFFTEKMESIGKFDDSGHPIRGPIGEPLRFGGAETSDASVAVNPTNGDLYVYDAGSIDTYDPNTGKLLRSFSVPVSVRSVQGLLFPIIQIAADSTGNVYVPVIDENEVLEYSPTGAPLKAFTGGVGPDALKGPDGVAIDSSGNVWVADTGNNRIEELSSADVPIDQIGSEGVESIALDGRGDVFAIVKNGADFCGAAPSPCAHLVEYDSAGSPVADVGAGSFKLAGASEFGLPSMVAVNEASGRVYVTDTVVGMSRSRELVWMFGPPTAPSVGKELSAEVGASEVKLGALVDPGGIPTSYRFEYGTSTAYGQSTPFPEGSAGEGLSSRTVWAAAVSLTPGTIYHYRVVASNELGTVDGPDQTLATLTAEQAECPNELLRGGFSVRLPDCRAYELVTTPVKTSVQAEGVEAVAADGNRVLFPTKEPLPGAPTGGNHYVATRGTDGWSAEDVIPLESYTSIICETHSNSLLTYSDELSQVLISVGRGTRASGESDGLEVQECNADGLQVVPGEPVGYQNLLLRDDATGTYQLVNVTSAGVTPSDAHFKGASGDLSHVVFTEMAPLAPGTRYGVENLYEWDEGVVRLVSVLPDKTPVVGSLAGKGGPSEEAARHVISADGSHIAFTANGGLYVRIDGDQTVRIDEAQQGAPGPSGSGFFQGASADGSRMLFTDTNRLTAGSTAAPGEPDLYECELVEEEQSGKKVTKCQLRDLTVAKAGEHADVLSVSELGSQDSSHVYFSAMGVLASNTREYVDSEGRKVVEGAQSGKPNLYEWNGRTVTFIAEGSALGEVSPDGTWIAFSSTKSLTGYDNRGPSNGEPVVEFFLYSTASKELVCVSCNPDGEAPSGEPKFGDGEQRYLSDGGRVFFETPDALVPSDTNGQVDVYEYEDGHVYLISTGTSPFESGFQGASENGNDVFFFSTQQLVPQDTEEEMHVIYDARVDGGLPAIASPPTCTNADACRSAVSPQPSIYGTPSSQTFSGEGNVTPAAQASKVKKKAKSNKKQKTRHRACGRLRGKHKSVTVCESKHRKHRVRKASKSGRRSK
jgi:hypothetical protein